MPISVHHSILKDQPDVENIKLALAYLEAAESLNIEMIAARTPESFYRGQPVLWLAFHALELFLKGFILKLAPGSNPSGHSIPELLDALQALDSTIEIPHPFGVEAMPDYPEFVVEAKRLNRTLHEQLRYMSDRSGEPWPGIRGFSAALFQQTLTELRTYLEKAYDKVFREGDD